jgi:hypothetical protein
LVLEGEDPGEYVTVSRYAKPFRMHTLIVIAAPVFASFFGE